MSVRVGVDVGGTFTKAVACDSGTGAILARSVVPTTHAAPSGVAQGVVTAVGSVKREVEERNLGPILLVSHSTTQAVNALLEGDTSRVGVLGIGRRPDLRRARKRTHVDEIRLAPGRRLKTVHSFIDATHGLEPERLRDEIRSLQERGAEVLAVSEAFGVDDARSEWLALEVADDLGMPACAGHELTGLYGLEMRTVTSALNAGILPTALRTARLVEEAVRERGAETPILVMRGDGGAASLEAMKKHPLLTAFSGPAASVSGALRHLALHDGVVVEVGGTSTNVSAVRGGRPVLSYVRVLDHVTCVRSLDVRVVGVAGGSLIRVGRRLGRERIEDVGPRSAHIGGLPYCAFSSHSELRNAAAVLISPRAGDPRAYVALETRDGRRLAPTVTCAANALGEIPENSYAFGDGDAARAAFEAVGDLIGTTWEQAARRTLQMAAGKVAEVVSEVIRDQELGDPRLVGLGGGGGALVPRVARLSAAPWDIPRDAEVISSVGDALSLVRVEIERNLNQPSAKAIAQIHHEAEEAVIGAGASPTSIQVESRAVPERGALRVTAFGSVSLGADATPTEPHLDMEALRVVAKAELGGDAELVMTNGFFALFRSRDGKGTDIVVLDRQGTLASKARGDVVVGAGREVAAQLDDRVTSLVRHYGPVAVAPAIRVVRGTRLVDLTVFSAPDKALSAASSECALGGDDPVAVILSRD